MKQVFIDTYGCQMNVADSDRMERILFQSGYLRTPNKEEADLILVNTCSIREKAAQKIFSLFGNLKPLKRDNPDVVFGLTGCLAQQEGKTLVGRIPDLDFVLGPDAVENIAAAVDRVMSRGGPVVWTEFDTAKSYSLPRVEEAPETPAGPSAFVNIIKGCDKFCSFCVVPFTRGREKSREPEEICREVRQWVDRGAREIILLGQNVNSYGKRGLKHPLPFHELLYRVAGIPGVERLRFTTSHPQDFTPGLIAAFRDLDVLMNHLHLPVQSGNDRILQRMRRGYTVAEYIGLIEELKSRVPGMGITSDIIVGFPEETESEFEDTLRLMERVGFDYNYMFTYSPRPGTPAAEFDDSIPEETKKARLQKTIDLQNRLTRRNGSRFVGQCVEVMIEGRTRRHGADFKGRSPQYWMVNFTASDEDRDTLLPGGRVWVEIDGTQGHALTGWAGKAPRPVPADSLR